MFTSALSQVNYLMLVLASLTAHTAVAKQTRSVNYSVAFFSDCEPKYVVTFCTFLHLQHSKLYCFIVNIVAFKVRAVECLRAITHRKYFVLL